MFYDEKNTIESCEDEPSLIFNVITEGHKQVVEKIISKKDYNYNITDENGNNVLQALLNKNWYDLVLKALKNKNIDINNQNNQGNTFAHVLVTRKYLDVMDIIKQLLKKEQFIPNIRNKKGETILDKSINDNYIYTTIKILEDERFNNIDLVSFKNLYDNYIKSNNYGIYSKINNLEVILDNLVDKELLPKVKSLVNTLINNFETIKNEVINNDTKELDKMIKTAIAENK